MVALTAALLAAGSAPTFGMELALSVLGTFFVGLIFVVGEEFGWRGFLQPALQDRWSALLAAIIVGLVWAAWHLPLFFDPDTAQAGVPPLSFIALGVGLSVVLGWLYNSTRASLLIVVLGHATINASLGGVALALPDELSVSLFVSAFAAAVWAALVALIVLFGPRTLTPGRHEAQ